MLRQVGSKAIADEVLVAATKIVLVSALLLSLPHQFKARLIQRVGRCGTEKEMLIISSPSLSVAVGYSKEETTFSGKELDERRRGGVKNALPSFQVDVERQCLMASPCKWRLDSDAKRWASLCQQSHSTPLGDHYATL